jgi:Cdc6-like AAA superfamily ATPase
MTTVQGAPSIVERVSDFRKDIKVSPEMNQRLESLMFALGIKTKSKALEKLLDEFGKENSDLIQSKVATLDNVLSELAPICIYGKPGAGKSFTLRKLVSEAATQQMSVILIDVGNEHSEISPRKISATSAIARRFGQGIYRIVPDRDPRQRQFSIQRLFEHLNMLAFRGRLKQFFIAIDEGNELKEVKEVYDFLIESRKYVRKAVIISADPAPFDAICVLMLPYPKVKKTEGLVNS